MRVLVMPSGGWVRRATACLLAAATVAAAGCGDGGGSEQEASATKQEGLTKVDVGVLPISAVAPVYVGIKQGFFKAEGLDVEPHFLEGGAAVVPAIVSGDLDFGYSNPGSVLLAAGRGLPLKIVAEGNQTLPDATNDPDTLVSSTRDAKDLVGEKLAVDTLGGLTELATRVALRKLGVDDKKVDFVEVGFPDMLTALDSGRVHAAKMNEPFVSTAEKTGKYHALTHPFFATLGPNASISEYITSAKFAQENADVVTRFQRAMNHALDYSQQNPEAVRKLVPTYTKITPDIAEKIKLTYFSSKLNTESIKRLARLMVQNGLLEEEPDVDGLLQLGS